MLAKEEYLLIAVEAVIIFVRVGLLGTTKHKKHETLETGNTCVCLSSIPPRIELLCKTGQADVSH